jgi:hypothetical protein
MSEHSSAEGATDGAPSGPTRRTVLVGAGLFAATLAAPAVLGQSPAFAVAARPAALRGLRRSRFSPALRSHFLARGAGGPFRLVLTEIRDLPNAHTRDADHSFNLLFRVKGRAIPPEGIYRLVSGKTGSATLFISPVGSGARMMQALVNNSR